MPLHPAWAGWLWARAVERGEARELASYGLAAYRCVPDVAALTVDVQEDVRAGELPVPPVDGGDVRMVAPRERPAVRDAA